MMAAALLRRHAAKVPGATRAFRAAKPRQAGTAAGDDWSTYIFKSDHSPAGMHLYHKLNMGLIAIGPLALMVPSGWTFPLDLAMGVMIPLHSHLGARRLLSVASVGTFA